jgi:hypothetical protein
VCPSFDRLLVRVVRADVRLGEPGQRCVSQIASAARRLLGAKVCKTLIEATGRLTRSPVHESLAYYNESLAHYTKRLCALSSAG